MQRKRFLHHGLWLTSQTFLLLPRRPIPNADGTLPLPPGFQPPPGMNMPGMPQGPGGQGANALNQVAPGMAGAQAAMGAGGQDLPVAQQVDEEEEASGSTGSTGRPEESVKTHIGTSIFMMERLTLGSMLSRRPPMFHRQPVQNVDNDYPDFAPFAFPARMLFRIDRLKRPSELKHCDVRPDEWAYFIQELEREVFAEATRRETSSSWGSESGTGYGMAEEPLLTEKVHQLLR